MIAPGAGGSRQQVSEPSCFGGFAATEDFFYVTDRAQGSRRINRVTTATDVISANPFTLQVPAIWNGQLDITHGLARPALRGLTAVAARRVSTAS